MIVNNVKDKKGFRDFPTLEETSIINFNSENIFLSSPLEYGDNSLGQFYTTGSAFPRFKIDENSFINSKQKNKKDLRDLIKTYNDNQKKVFYIDITTQFAHFFLETFALLLMAHESSPNSLFIINFSGLSKDAKKEHSFLSLLEDFVLNNNVDHFFIENNSVIALNNFYYFTQVTPSNEVVDLIYNFLQKYVKDKNIVPTKKVFLSRKYTPCERGTDRNIEQIIKRGKWVNSDEKNIIGVSDIRLHNESYLHAFFESFGFEIVYPEKFKDINEQINFFNGVKTVVSTTSSSLVNSIFMPPGGTIIELITPLLTDRARFDIHSDLYLFLSYVKKHEYFAIPNKYTANELLDYFNNKKVIIDFLRSL